ncbi:hypothetical protein AB0D11_35730 [Streptomyces monashensis]|uniref:hypothetical protein n=1 Tax=Streptomyces monashensis TaxID=1678012 RepID=UPI0033D22129
MSEVGLETLTRTLPPLPREGVWAGRRQVPRRSAADFARHGGAVRGRESCATRRGGSGCARHARWQLDADADQVLEHPDLRGLPEIVAACRRWTGVACRAGRSGAEPGQVFTLAHAVVARWWEQALHWQPEYADKLRIVAEEKWAPGHSDATRA